MHVERNRDGGYRSDMSTNSHDRSMLAASVRAFRRKAGLTLQQLSERTGMSVSMLSKLENGSASISYDKLCILSSGLDVSLTEMISGEIKTADRLPKSASARRAYSHADQGLVEDTSNYRYLYVCNELAAKQMTPFVVDVRARRLTEFGPLVSHFGEEFIFVIQGKLLVVTESYAELTLEQYGSVYLDSTMKHAYLNVAEGETRILCVCWPAIESVPQFLANLTDRQHADEL
jgi:transcriptional regulator with XRE-family HTH domain